MTSTAKDQGKPEKRKMNLSDAYEESGEDSDDFLIDAYARLGLKDRRGKAENRKRKLSNADESEEEESATVAAEKTARKKLKETKKDQLESHGDYSDEVEEKKARTEQSKSEKIDSLRLYLRGLPGNTTEADIQKLFPEAVEIVMTTARQNNLLFGYGFVGFNDPALTSKYHDQGQDLVLHGKKLVVLYARQRKRWKNRKNAKQRKSEKKKMQTQKDDEDDSEEEKAKSKKRKRDNKEGPAAKKPKKAGAVNGDTQITMYIINLSKNTTEDVLYNLFSENSIRVTAVRKRAKKNNAFVELEDNDDLENALALNGTSLNKNTITVEKAKPSVQQEKNNQSFSSPGDRFNKGEDNTKVVDDDDEDDDNENSSDDEDDSEDEEAKSNTRKRDNKEGPAAKKAEAVNGDEKNTPYIGNLNRNTTEDDLSNLFSEISINVAAVRKGKKKNDTFVDLECNDDLENALTLNGTNLNKSSITVEKAKPSVQNEKNSQSFSSPGDRFNKGDDNKDSCTLFVKNLPDNATVDNLSAIFDTASDVRIPIRDGVHKGFGFVKFSDKESLEAGMSEKQEAKFKRK